MHQWLKFGGQSSPNITMIKHKWTDNHKHNSFEMVEADFQSQM